MKTVLWDSEMPTGMYAQLPQIFFKKKLMVFVISDPLSCTFANF